MSITTILKIGLLKRGKQTLTMTSTVNADVINLLEETKSSYISMRADDGTEFTGEYVVKKVTAGTIYAELTDESRAELEALYAKSKESNDFKLQVIVDNTKR